LELYECPPTRLDDPEAVVAALRSAATSAGATMLSHVVHRFTPHGVTALGLLAESHISIHTWPERGYVACDVFTCGDRTDPERARAWGAARHWLRYVARGDEPVRV